MGWSHDQPPPNYGPASVPGWAGKGGHVINLLLTMGRRTWLGRDGCHVISLLLTTAWAVFSTWLGWVGWSCDQPLTNYDMGRLLYLAGPGGLVT